MTKKIYLPDHEGQRVVLTGLGTTLDIARYADEPEPVATLVVRAGKMDALDVELTAATAGHISVRDDGGSYLNLNDIPADVTQITGTDVAGRTIDMQVLPKRQLAGYSAGRNWMLPIDKATGLILFEPGRNGRTLYVTRGAHGYTRAMIATEDGVAESVVTDSYIRSSNKWGRTAAKAVEASVGMLVWKSMVQSSNLYQSNRLLLERGYDYNGVANLDFIHRGSSGESPLHPQVVDAYGTGTLPVIGKIEPLFQLGTPADSWFAFQSLKMTAKLATISPFDMIASHIESVQAPGAFYVQNRGHKTIYRCAAINPSRPTPGVEGDWGYPAPHDCGIYANECTSLLVLDMFIDQAGWRDGYNPESNSTLYPHPPSGLAHGMYLQFNFAHTTIRRCIVSRSSSQSLQIRGGGTVEDSFLIDGNMIGNNLGRAKDPATGNSDTVGTGSYALYMGCVATSAAYKDAHTRIYNIRGGLDATAFDSELIDMIIMHAINPNDPAEIAFKSVETTDAAVNQGFFRNGGRGDLLRVHNWRPGDPLNNATKWGANVTTLNQTTIQNYVTDRMGAAVNGVPEMQKIKQWCLWLRTLNPAQRMEELTDVLDYFRAPWGLSLPKRVNPSICVFQPSDRTSGMLWADRYNWTTKDTAGTVDGDSAELRGAKVRFGELTVEMDVVDGEGGELEVSSGRLTVDDLRNVAEVKTIISGQIWIGAQTAVNRFIAESGRIAWTGPATGHDVTVDGQFPEILLGPSHTVANGKVMDLRVGPQGAVGWDGTGTAVLTIASGGRLRLRAWDATRMTRLSVFRSGRWGETAPTVTASLMLASGAVVEVDTAGLQPGTYDLTGPGVTVTNNGATLPAGVSVTGGKLVMTV